eukprot:272565_1
MSTPSPCNSLLLCKMLLLLSIFDIVSSFTSLSAGIRPAACRQVRIHAGNVQRLPNTLRPTTSLAIFRQKERAVIEETDENDTEDKDTVSILKNIFASNVEDDSTNLTVEKEVSGMGDLVKMLQRDDASPTIVVGEESADEENSLGQVVAVGALATLVSALVATGFMGGSDFDLGTISMNIQTFFADPKASLEAVVQTVEAMGPMGYAYFGAIYTVAEVLAIPAIPLTASAGYLFGVRDGTAVVLASASIAAAISFMIGRTFLRSYVEKLLEGYPEFKKIDRAIGEEGFKIMLLLRLSPIFPFALSNYLYGVTSIEFWPFFWGTMLGFTPGTIAYVFTGEIGKSLTLESSTAQPWYIYAGALALLSGFLKIAADVATGIIESVQDEDE